MKVPECDEHEALEGCEESHCHDVLRRTRPGFCEMKERDMNLRQKTENSSLLLEDGWFCSTVSAS